MSIPYLQYSVVLGLHYLKVWATCCQNTAMGINFDTMHQKTDIAEQLILGLSLFLQICQYLAVMIAR